MMDRSTRCEKIVAHIPPDLRSRVEAAAVEEGRSISAIIRRLLAERFQAAEPERPRP
jgi:hypothetical protein